MNSIQHGGVHVLICEKTFQRSTFWSKSSSLHDKQQKYGDVHNRLIKLHTLGEGDSLVQLTSKAIGRYALLRPPVASSEFALEAPMRLR